MPSSQSSAPSLSSRSPSPRTVALIMNVSQIWYFKLIWTSEAPGGMDMNRPNRADLRQTRRDLKGDGGLFLAQGNRNETSGSPSTLGCPLSTTPRKDPFVVRGGRRKVLVSATLENKKENAYNTSLSLNFSRNLHLSSFTPQVPLGKGVQGNQGRRKTVGVLAMRASGKGCV